MAPVRGDGMRGLAVFISDIRNCKFKQQQYEEEKIKLESSIGHLSIELRSIVKMNVNRFFLAHSKLSVDIFKKNYWQKLLHENDKTTFKA